MISTLDIQRALLVAGFPPGPLDGIPGRLTRKAIASYKSKLGVRGGAVADAALLEKLFPGNAAALAVPPVPPWFEEVLRRKGLHESRDNAALWAWLRSGGGSVGDPAHNPWCGDCVETPIAITLPDEPLPANPYLARSWARFGVPCEPTPGAIMAFWRGSRSGYLGHVAFYDGEGLIKGVPSFRVVGGNQKNAITEAWLAKDRLLASRWPATFPLPHIRKVVLSGGGALSTNEA